MKLNKITYFYPEKPVLMMKEADSFQEMSDSPLYVSEPKFNGQRCELHLLDGEVEFWDRHGKHLDYNSNCLYENERNLLIKELVLIFGDKGYFVLDCELRHNKVHGIQNKLVIYDIHVYKNELLNKLTFRERRAILERYFGQYEYNEGSKIHLINQYKENFQRVYDDYVSGLHGDSEEFEGIVIKHLDGKLKLGRVSGINSTWMFKVRKKTGRHRY